MIPAAAVSLGPEVLLSTSFEATEAAVRKAVVQVTLLLDRCELGPDRCQDMLLVLGEVLNNIVEHSCVGVPDAQVALTISQARDGLVVETRDTGRPIPPSLMRGAQLPPIDVPISDLPEGGFGWFIIHSLVDDMAYERSGNANVLSFTFRES